MRIVIDTNVVASAVFFGGVPKKLIQELFNGSFEAYVSEEIVQEYFETYEALHRKYEEKGNPDFLKKIIEKSNIVVPRNEVHVCRDPDDDKFISCALEGKCIYIVSGDKDLLSLEKFDDIQIVKVSDFLHFLNK